MEMSHCLTILNILALRLTKTQIGLGIHPVKSESLSITFLHVDNEDTDQMPRLNSLHMTQTLNHWFVT